MLHYTIEQVWKSSIKNFKSNLIQDILWTTSPRIQNWEKVEPGKQIKIHETLRQKKSRYFLDE